MTTRTVTTPEEPMALPPIPRPVEGDLRPTHDDVQAVVVAMNARMVRVASLRDEADHLDAEAEELRLRGLSYLARQWGEDVTDPITGTVLAAQP